MIRIFKYLFCMLHKIKNWTVKEYAILLLSVALVLVLIFKLRPQPVTSNSKELITQLQNKVDSLENLNNVLKLEFDSLSTELSKVDEENHNFRTKIEVLQHNRMIVKHESMKMSANQVSEKYNEYLKTHK